MVIHFTVAHFFVSHCDALAVYVWGREAFLVWEQVGNSCFSEMTRRKRMFFTLVLPFR